MCSFPQIFSVQRRHPELADDLLHPDLPLAGLRLHSDREIPGGGGPRGLDGPARHTEQTGQQDTHLAPGKLTYIYIFGGIFLIYPGFLHHGFVLHQLILDYDWLWKCVREHSGGENILDHHNVHRRFRLF